MMDALVVGAGPAGSIAALCLARAGVRVRLLDRAAFPRPKLCGDTLNPGSLALLERLGVDAEVRREALPITGMMVTGPAGAVVAADYPDALYGLSLRRHDLDLALVEAAVAGGVTFDPATIVQAPVLSDDGARVVGVRIGHGRHQGTLHSRIVIAADGRASRLASSLRLSRFAASPKRWAYGAYFEGVEGLSSRGEMHIRGDGYIGVAPVPGGAANVCVVNTPGGTPFRHSGRPGGRARGGAPPYTQVIEAAVATDDALRERFARARRVSEVAVLGPLAVEALAAGRPGLLLAGDAAGFVDPMTGDGMRFALRGGELAAHSALRELESGAAAYEALAGDRAREFSGKWRINRALRVLVDSPRALDLAAVVARRWTAPVEYLIGVAGDVALANPRCPATS
jgi:flavin-dependent dehydrogenase